jgi:hypothetical protein
MSSCRRATVVSRPLSARLTRLSLFAAIFAAVLCGPVPMASAQPAPTPHPTMSRSSLAAVGDVAGFSETRKTAAREPLPAAQGGKLENWQAALVAGVVAAALMFVVGKIRRR